MRLPSFGAACVYVVCLSGSFAAAAPSATPCGNRPIPSPTPSSIFHCDIQGTTLDQRFLARFKSSTGDITPCFDSCLGDAKCISFAYNTTSATCLTFAQTVNDKTFTRSNSSGVFYYNRKGCFMPATCKPAPHEFIGNGGFENAVADSNGAYSSNPWKLYGAAIQMARGSGHSSFSTSCTDSCGLVQMLPNNLINGSYYKLSMDYMVPANPLGANGRVFFGFIYTQANIAILNLHNVTRTYTTFTKFFQYKEYTGMTNFALDFVADDNEDALGMEIVMDNISIVDALPPPTA